MEAERLIAPATALPLLRHRITIDAHTSAGRAKILKALNKVADDHGVDAAAIAGVIHTESVWKTDCVTGQYIGLTQVGPELLEELGLTRRKFLALPPEDQISAYGTWLDYYKFVAKMTALGISVGKFPVARQAAVLQAMQFSPNGRKWKAALAEGDLTVRSTPSRQAEVLGDTSIGDMERYYKGFFVRNPPVYEDAPARIAARAAKSRANA